MRRAIPTRSVAPQLLFPPLSLYPRNDSLLTYPRSLACIILYPFEVGLALGLVEDATRRALHASLRVVRRAGQLLRSILDPIEVGLRVRSRESPPADVGTYGRCQQAQRSHKQGGS